MTEEELEKFKEPVTLKLNKWETEYLKQYNFDISNKNYDYVEDISEKILSDEINNTNNIKFANKLWHLYEKFNKYLDYLYFMKDAQSSILKFKIYSNYTKKNI